MATEQSVSGRFIDVKGASLYYEEHGAGPPMVLIHGGLSAHDTWEPFLPHLTGDFRVITPDSRGHGRSTNPSGELSYMQLADDVAALVGELGLERPVVGGYSDGGQVALELGARHPDTAGSLLVGAAYPDFAVGGLREYMRAFLGTDDSSSADVAHVDATLGAFADRLKSRHGGEEQWRTLLEQTGPMWIDYPGLPADAVRAIETPTLVYTGDRDEMFPFDLMLTLFRELPNAELGVCPGADHFAGVMPERAGVFAALIRDFATRHT